MNSTKEMLSDVLQTVMGAELEDKLGYEKSELTSDKAEKGCKNTAYDEEQRNSLLFFFSSGISKPHFFFVYTVYSCFYTIFLHYFNYMVIIGIYKALYSDS